MSPSEDKQEGVTASELWSATGKGKKKQLASFRDVLIAAYTEPQAVHDRDLHERDPASHGLKQTHRLGLDAQDLLQTDSVSAQTYGCPALPLP